MFAKKNPFLKKLFQENYLFILNVQFHFFTSPAHTVDTIGGLGGSSFLWKEKRQL